MFTNIQLLNKDKPGPQKVFNQIQMFNLKWSEPPSVASTSPMVILQYRHSNILNLN